MALSLWYSHRDEYTKLELRTTKPALEGPLSQEKGLHEILLQGICQLLSCKYASSSYLSKFYEDKC